MSDLFIISGILIGLIVGMTVGVMFSIVIENEAGSQLMWRGIGLLGGIVGGAVGWIIS
jgi:hypothetical protein